MGSPQQQSSLPGRQAVRGWLTRSRQLAASAPLPVKVLLIALACVFAPALIAIGLLAALMYAPYALFSGGRSWFASLPVALWGGAVTAALAHGADEPRYLLLLLPWVVSGVARVGLLGRWPVPCRTAAWAMIWSLPVGIAAFRLLRSHALFGPAAAWLIALVVLGWRLAKALQDSREHDRRAGLTGALAAPYAMAAAGPASRFGAPGPGTAGPAGAGFTGTGPANAGTSAGRGGRAGTAGPGLAPGSALGSAGQSAPVSSGTRPPCPPAPLPAAQAGRGGGSLDAREGGQPRVTASGDWPVITVDEAMAELNAMVG